MYIYIYIYVYIYTYVSMSLTRDHDDSFPSAQSWAVENSQPGSLWNLQGLWFIFFWNRDEVWFPPATAPGQKLLIHWWFSSKTDIFQIGSFWPPEGGRLAPFMAPNLHQKTWEWVKKNNGTRASLDSSVPHRPFLPNCSRLLIYFNTKIMRIYIYIYRDKERETDIYIYIDIYI